MNSLPGFLMSWPRTMTRPGAKVTSRLGSKQARPVPVCTTSVLWRQCCWRSRRRWKARSLHSFSISWLSIPNKALWIYSETLQLSLVSFFIRASRFHENFFYSWKPCCHVYWVSTWRFVLREREGGEFLATQQLRCNCGKKPYKHGSWGNRQQYIQLHLILGPSADTRCRAGHSWLN